MDDGPKPLDAPRSSALSILARLEAGGFAGWDPYDGLSARRVPESLLRTARGRQALTQLAKRSSGPMRRFLDIPDGVSAYTLGHVLSAYARLHEQGLLADAQQRAASVVAQLESMVLPGWSGACWGYHFDVQTRFFFYDKRTPNAIVTAFVAKGLAEATESGLIDGRSLLRGVGEFILHDLPRVVGDAGQCFGYIPSSDTVVHNANALSAMTLARVSEVGGSDVLHEAVQAARFVVKHQRTDGAWAYSEQSDGRWIDGFHTGFVLEGLGYVAAASGDRGIRESVSLGLDFYVASLFDVHGRPRYFDTKALPYDALSAAQGIETLSVLEDGRVRFGELRDELVGWTLATLVSGDGSVAYRRWERHTDWRQYPRWSLGPMCSALSGAGGC